MQEYVQAVPGQSAKSQNSGVAWTQVPHKKQQPVGTLASRIDQEVSQGFWRTLRS